MGNFDKDNLGIGSKLAVLVTMLPLLTGLLDFAQRFKEDDKSEISTSQRIQIVTESSNERVIEQAGIIKDTKKELPTVPRTISTFINDLQYMSCKNNIEEQETLTDNIGKEHYNGLFMYEMHSVVHGDYRHGGSANYYIEGKYTNFSGTVAVPKGNEDNERSAFFEVYGDDNLLYTSPVMTNTSPPKTFSIDITDVKILTISYPDSNKDSQMATLYDGLFS